MTVERLQYLQNRVFRINTEMYAALRELSDAASEIYGQELIADLCNGDEIEFRLPASDLKTECRIEDLISILRNNNN